NDGEHRENRRAQNEIEKVCDDRDQHRDASYDEQRAPDRRRVVVMPVTAQSAALARFFTPAAPRILAGVPIGTTLRASVFGVLGFLAGFGFVDRKFIANPHTEFAHGCLLASDDS